MYLSYHKIKQPRPSRRRLEAEHPRQQVDKLGNALARDRRNRQKRDLAPAAHDLQAREASRIVEGVYLGRQHQLLAARKVAVEQFEFAEERLEILDRIALLRDVDEMDEDLRPLNVLEKLVAQTVSLVRPLDQTGNVGNDEAAEILQGDDPQVRFQRREGIVRDLRPGGADPRDESGLADVGKA